MLLNPLVLSSVFRLPNTKGESEDFRSKIKEEARIKTIGELLYVIRRMKKLHDTKPITDLCLFKEGVEPMWEDPQNISGGKWILKIKKDTVDQRLFEKLMVWLAAVPFQTMEVNGIVVSVRGYQTILSLWTKTCPERDEKIEQEKEIRSMLGLKTAIIVAFKGNEESMKDRSSFRNVLKEKEEEE